MCISFILDTNCETILNNVGNDKLHAHIQVIRDSFSAVNYNP